MNTLFSASGYRIAMKIDKGCVLEYYETVEKFDNYTKPSRILRDFETGPSNEDCRNFVFNRCFWYIFFSKQNELFILSWQ